MRTLQTEKEDTPDKDYIPCLECRYCGVSWWSDRLYCSLLKKGVSRKGGCREGNRGEVCSLQYHPESYSWVSSCGGEWYNKTVEQSPLQEWVRCPYCNRLFKEQKGM